MGGLAGCEVGTPHGATGASGLSLGATEPANLTTPLHSHLPPSHSPAVPAHRAIPVFVVVQAQPSPSPYNTPPNSPSCRLACAEEAYLTLSCETLCRCFDAVSASVVARPPIHSA